MSLATFPDNYAPLPMRPGRRILHEVCAAHGITVAMVVGDRRFAPIVRCRREIAARLASETDMSFPRIGLILNKDHTSIIMAIRRWNESTGENIRGLGHIPEATRARNIASARRARVPISPEEKRRRAKLYVSRAQFYKAQAQ